MVNPLFVTLFIYLCCPMCPTTVNILSMSVIVTRLQRIVGTWVILAGLRTGIHAEDSR